MIVEAVIVSLIIGFIRKGKVINFAFVDVKWIYLFMFGAVIQAFVFNLTSPDASGLRLWMYENFYWLHLISYLLLLVPLVLNHALRGFKFMMIGTFMNFLPIFANGAKMPVKVPEGYNPIFDLGHVLLTEATKIKLLSDLIFVGPPYPLPKVISIGDLFLVIGVFWFIQYVMTNENNPNKKLPTN